VSLAKEAAELLYHPEDVPKTEANRKYWEHRALASVPKEALPSLVRHPIQRFKAGRSVKKARVRKYRQDAMAMGDFSGVDV